MIRRGYAPGWIARCPRCDYQTDLASLGWVRIGAYSWGKRQRMHCPRCQQARWMKILHLDEQGQPDQSLPKVLLVVLLMQIVIAALVIGLLMVTGIIPIPW